MNMPTPLRAITLHPWWAYAITHGDKRAAGKQGWWTCTDEQREAIARSLAVTP